MGWMLTLMWYVFLTFQTLLHICTKACGHMETIIGLMHEGRKVHATYDSGMACIFKQGSQCFTWERNIVVVNLHYINVVKINALSYGRLWLVLMKCSWIPINTCGNAIIRQDEYGFWVVNHCQRVLAHVEPYVFPSTISQVSPWYCYENLANHEQWNTYHMHFLAKESGLYNSHNYKVKIKLGF
jgi:hypothetical protein